MFHGSSEYQHSRYMASWQPAVCWGLKVWLWCWHIWAWTFWWRNCKSLLCHGSATCCCSPRFTSSHYRRYRWVQLEDSIRLFECCRLKIHQIAWNLILCYYSGCHFCRIKICSWVSYLRQPLGGKRDEGRRAAVFTAVEHHNRRLRVLCHLTSKTKKVPLHLQNHCIRIVLQEKCMLPSIRVLQTLFMVWQ